MDCGAVMMCSCDEEIGTKYLPHQLTSGECYVTKDEIAVTLGFQQGVCRECRGLPAEANPLSATFGRTSNVKRYYWRELSFREFEIYEELGGDSSTYRYEPQDSEIIKKAKEQALSEIKRLHTSSQKYDYISESNESFIQRLQVPVREINGIFTRDDKNRGRIIHQGVLLTVEEYAAEIYRGLGYEILELESMPIHALFGVFTWLLIEDPSDEKVQLSSFGERSAYERDGSKNPIWVPLPSDFGSCAYARRRHKTIDKHFSSLSHERDDLLWLFDYWVPCSEGLRQYLWAHRTETVERARKLVEILEPSTIMRILKYLMDGYWERYLGWPDLLAYNEKGYSFVEVKLSKDKLSSDQRQWIKHNVSDLHFPFEICKINRVAAQQNHTADRHSAALRAGS